MLHKCNTYISGNSSCKSENETSQSSVDGWRDDRYEGRQTNDNSRQEVKPNGEPSVDCTIVIKYGGASLRAFSYAPPHIQ